MKSHTRLIFCGYCLLSCSILLSAQTSTIAAPGTVRTQADRVKTDGLPVPKTVDEKLTDALQNAQTLYIQEDESTVSKKPQTPSLNFLIFYNGVQSLARYQLVPTTAGADLIVRFEWMDEEPPVFQITVFDPKTLNIIALQQSPYIGMFKASQEKEVNWLVDFVKQHIGTSKAAGAINTLPPPTMMPRSFTDPAARDSLVSAHSVFLLDGGQPAGFLVAPHVTCDELKAVLENWGRYKVVSSPDLADLVMQISGTNYLYTANASASHEESIHVQIMDAKTLQNIWSAYNSPVVLKRSFKNIFFPVPIYLDPEATSTASVQNIVNMLKKEAGDPVTK